MAGAHWLALAGNSVGSLGWNSLGRLDWNLLSRVRLELTGKFSSGTH